VCVVESFVVVMCIYEYIHVAKVLCALIHCPVDYPLVTVD